GDGRPRPRRRPDGRDARGRPPGGDRLRRLRRGPRPREREAGRGPGAPLRQAGRRRGQRRRGVRPAGAAGRHGERLHPLRADGVRGRGILRPCGLASHGPDADRGAGGVGRRPFLLHHGVRLREAAV
ncbi:MAG: hypothetical protein AVDCRST_MAG02-294, partial [uncultured Rubrobacteraceae bacterium]